VPERFIWFLKLFMNNSLLRTSKNVGKQIYTLNEHIDKQCKIHVLMQALVTRHPSVISNSYFTSARFGSELALTISYLTSASALTMNIKRNTQSDMCN